MKLSDKGLMALISHEAIVQSRYKDSKGIWTIGIGHTAAAGPPDPAKFSGTMTILEVFDLLRKDVANYEAAVSKAVKVPVAQHEFDALVSFHYNTGAIAKATLVKRLNAGNRSAAAKGFDAWTKPPEIKDRRMAEKALFQTGVYPKPFANLYPATPQGKILWAQGKRVDLIRALQIAAPAKPADKPASTQEPAKPTLPAPDPATRPSGLIGGLAAAVLASLTAALVAAQCAMPDFVINWFGYAAKCTGGN